MQMNHDMETIFEIMLNSPAPIGVHEVMQYLDISQSSAYLLIQKCELWLKENHMEVVSLEQRRELVLKDQKARAALWDRLSNMCVSEFELSAQERRSYIILMLIRKRYIRTNYLTSIFAYSRNTCIQDLAKIRQVLQRFAVDLLSGNRGYMLAGKEYDVYRLSLWIVSDVLSELYPHNYKLALSLFGFPKDKIREQFGRLFEEMQQVNAEISREAGYIFCAAYSLIEKRIHNDGLSPPDHLPHELEMNPYSSGMRRLLLRSGMVEDLFCGLTVKEDEREALTESLARMLIFTCVKTGTEIGSIHISEEELYHNASQIILNYENYIGIIFEDRDSLKKAVILNLKHVLLRRKYRFELYNSLTNEMRKHYSHILAITIKALEGVPYVGENVSEEDAVLFGVSFMGWMYKSRRSTCKTLRILIVCAGNVGTGVLLRGQIEQFLPGAQVLTASRMNHIADFVKYVDVIITTIPMESKGIPVIVVNTFLTEHDKNRIKQLTEHKITEDADLVRFLQDYAFMSKDFVSAGDRASLQHRLEEYFKINRVKIIYGTGGRPLLKDLITRNRIQIVETVKDWKEAIRIAARPLLDEKCIEPAYVEAMIHTVETLGPYIVLAPGLALPHARPEAGVLKMSMSLLKVNETVYFNEEKYASLFFVLASADGNSHLDALRELSVVFAEESAIARFMKAETTEELYDFIAAEDRNN